MTPASVNRACPLCDQTECTGYYQKGDLTLVRCRHCGMVYASPVAAELASGEFYDRLSVPFYLSPAKLESDYAPVRFERELRVFRAFCRQGAVLDVGCSTGAFLFQLQQQFPGDYQVLGTDVAGAALDYAESRGTRVARGPFLGADFGGRQFAAITFWAVLEHLAEPRRFLRHAVELLQPGGHCFILVPNLRSLAVRLLGAKYRYIMPDHVNYFSRTTLRQLIQTEAGLREVGGGSIHFNPMVIAQDLHGGVERVPDEARAQLLRRTTAYKQNPLLKPAKLLYAFSELVLGRFDLADNLYLVARKGGPADRQLIPPSTRPTRS